MNFKLISDSCKHRQHIELDWEGRMTEERCSYKDTSEIDAKFCDQDGEWKEPWGENQTGWLRAMQKLSEKGNFKCCESKCPLLK